MPIPYMGSKRRLSGKIFRLISQREKESKTIVDLFCGGLAISEEFLKNGWKVYSNDKNKYLIALAKKAIEGHFNDDVFTPEFIKRKQFIDVLKNKEKYDDWHVGYIQCIWSFGNKQRGYLFGKDVEKYKEAGHDLVIHKNSSKLLSLFPDLPKRYIDGILSLGNWHKRRIALSKVSHKLQTRNLELQQLEQLERLERLELSSKDYKEVSIPRGAVVYCDPPYQDTATYSEGGFKHEEFWEFVRKLSKTNSVYTSEYQAPKDFDYIASFTQNSTLHGGSNTKTKNEKVFILKGKNVKK